MGFSPRAWTRQPGFSYTLIGAWQDSELVGLAQRCAWEKEPDDHFVEVAVDAPHRLRGIGPELLQALEQSAGPAARRFVSEPFLASQAEVDVLTSGFAAKVGYRLGTVELCQGAELREETIPATRLAEGWTVDSYLDGIPEELLPEVGVIQGLVDEEAPSGEIEWHAHVVTPEEYRADLADVLAEGAHLVEAVAMAPDGRVAGWTAVTTPVSAEHAGHVVGTLVLEEFRGHGLGMALKSAVARRAIELGVTRVRTESDAANRWMLDINRRQGFIVTGVRAAYHKTMR